MKTQSLVPIFIVVSLVGFLIIQGIVTASSPGPVVDLTTGQYYQTIQQAINAASAGDTIQVSSGTYRENVIVNKQLTLIGFDNGAGLPVVDGSGNNFSIKITANNVQLQGFVVTDATQGIYIAGSYNIVAGNTANNNQFGIYLTSSNYNNVSGNTANYNSQQGIELFSSCNYNTLSGNTANNNIGYGICLLTSCSNNIVSGNTANNNQFGIFLTASSNNNIVSGNTANANTNYAGILLSTCNNNYLSGNTVGYNTNNGIYLYTSSKNNVSGNTANNNIAYGIDLYSSSNNNNVSGNTANNNGNGIFISGSKGNVICINTFGRNGQNAACDVSSNSWNSTAKLSYVYNGKTYTNYTGNYWGDYTGVSINGIGTTPYNINAPNNIDKFPMVSTPPRTMLPVTVCTLSSMTSCNGWNTSVVAVTLSASEEGGSIASTNYQLDGGAWTVYAGPFTVSDEGVHTLVFNSTDTAGNREADRMVTFKIDAVAPVTHASLSGSAGSNGWNTSVVSVTLSATDDVSGVANTYYTVDGVQQTYTGPFTVGDGVHVIKFWSVDSAGNVEDNTSAANTVTVKQDTVMPTISWSSNSMPNSAGWDNHSVLVHFSATTGVSGLASLTEDQVLTTSGAATGSVTDGAGRTASVTTPMFMIDTVAPLISGAATTQPNSNGWYNGNVVVHFDASDNGGSGIVTLTPDVIVSSEGAGQSVTGTAVDVAGNVASFTVSGINIDRTPPVTVCQQLSGITGANGWYTSSVQVTLQASDKAGGSRVATTYYTIDGGASQSYTAPFFVSGDGTHTLFYYSVDAAGNQEMAQPGMSIAAAQTGTTIKIDVTPPEITITAPGSGASYTQGQPVMAAWKVQQDTASGTDWASVRATAPDGKAIDTNTVGTKTFTVSAADNAGNTATKTVNYLVAYTVSLITPSSSKLNGVRLGSCVPVKLELRNANGNLITDAVVRLYLAKQTAAGYGPEVSAMSTNNPKNDNTFRNVGGQYMYNLDTSPLDAGTWELRARADYGTIQTMTIQIETGPTARPTAVNTFKMLSA